jgi:lysophospholipase L1-like esterase
MRLFALASLSLSLVFPHSPAANNVQKTVILGDSIVVSIRDDISQSIPNTVVNAMRSRTIASPVLTDAGLAQLNNLSLLKSPRWIIELGTNDAWSISLSLKQVKTDIQRFIKRLLEVVPSKTCVTWILPSISSPVAADIQKRAAAVRELLTAAQPAKRCWAFINWDDEVKANRALVGKDGVHLSTDGKKRFLALVKSVVK